MNFYDMIKRGAKIEAKPYKENMIHYESASFWYENNNIYSFTRSFGKMQRDDITPERFNNHIEQMIKEHFQIIISG